MLYLIGQITLLLILAMIAGMLLGWWSRSLQHPKTTVDSLSAMSDPFDARARLEQCHRDNALLRRELKESEEQLTKLRAGLASNGATDLLDRLHNAEARVSALLQDLQWRDDAIAALEQELGRLRIMR